MMFDKDKFRSIERFEDLPETLRAAGITPDQTYAMATSPGKCLLLRVNEQGELVDSSSNVLKLSDYYEVIAFSPDWQVTCVRNGAGASLDILKAPEVSSELVVIEQSYIMWGRVSEIVGSGWCKIADARVGQFEVPCPENTRNSQYLHINAREYIRRGEDGNAIVVAQRLVGLSCSVLEGAVE